MVRKKPQRWAGSASCRMNAGGTTRDALQVQLVVAWIAAQILKFQETPVWEQKRVLVTSAGGFMGIIS